MPQGRTALYRKIANAISVVQHSMASPSTVTHIMYEKEEIVIPAGLDFL